MSIYFIRHGETEYNKEDRLQGISDSPLTEKGKKQAYKLAEFFIKRNIDMIITSPLRRAKSTAEIISTKLCVPVYVDEKLREISYGSWDGRLKSELKNLDEWKLREKNKFSYKHKGEYAGISGESYNDLIYRLETFLKELPDQKSILVVSHLGILRAIKKIVDNCDVNEAASFSPKNEYIYLLTLDKKLFERIS